MNNFPTATLDNLIDMFRRTDIVLTELDGIEKAAGSVENISDVIGQSFSAVPDTFRDLRETLAAELKHRIEASLYGVLCKATVIELDSRVHRFVLTPVEDVVNVLVNGCGPSARVLTVAVGVNQSTIDFRINDIVDAPLQDDGSYHLKSTSNHISTVRCYNLVEVRHDTPEGI